LPESGLTRSPAKIAVVPFLQFRYHNGMRTQPLLPNEVWQRTPSEAQALILALQQQIGELRRQVDELKGEVKRLEEENRNLREQRRRNSTKSSKRASSDPPHHKAVGWVEAAVRRADDPP